MFDDFQRINDDWFYNNIKFDNDVVLSVKKIENELIKNNITNIYLYPGHHGDIAVSCYIDDHYFDFLIDKTSISIIYELEEQQIDYIKNCSLETTLDLINT